MALSKKNTPKLFIIDDETMTDPAVKDAVMMPTIDGERKGMGAEPRDYSKYPESMYAHPQEIDVIPASEHKRWIDFHEHNESSLKHIFDRNGMKVLDQNGEGFCWMYGAVMAGMLNRAKQGQKYVRLSPHAPACRAFNFQDRGAWCGTGAEQMRTIGAPTEEFWPQKSMSREHDSAATWANAALHKTNEEFVDLAQRHWDQKLTNVQIISQLLVNNPVQLDFAWWGHSVCGVYAVWLDGEAVPVIANSWTEQWGENGFGVIRGDKFTPMGAIAYCSTSAGAA